MTKIWRPLARWARLAVRPLHLGLSAAVAGLLIVAVLALQGSDDGTDREAQQALKPAPRPAIALTLPPADLAMKPARVTPPTLDEARREARPWLAQTAQNWGEKAAPPSNGSGPRIAIVIDDLGNDPGLARQAIALPAPVTLALLPYGRQLPRLAREARAAGHELLVHLPMQPHDAASDPGPNVLETALEAAELDRRIAWNLSRFDGFVGINNHMGSRFTEDEPAMRLLFAALRARGLLFLDSRTTAQSVGAPLAAAMHVAYAERDIFLDNALAAAAVAEQLALTEARARRFGNAIAIGHPHGVTLSQLASWLRALPAKGFVPVPVSQIVVERGTPLWRAAMIQDGDGFGLAGGSR
ncbi:MAG: divergent polysaccharide deacetylase family protein [Pseudomonadota bacterium]